DRARRGKRRRRSGNPVEVVVVAVQQSMVLIDRVVEFPEHPPRIGLRWIGGIGAWLGVPVALVFQRSEIPELVPDERTGHLHGRVAPLLAMIGPPVVEARAGVSRC